MEITLKANQIFPFKQMPEASHNIYLFHHLGGSASSYSKIAALFPSQFQVYFVELNGRGKNINNPFHNDFRDAINSLQEELLKQNNDRPYSFIAHSMGTLIAYELTLTLNSNSYFLPLSIFFSSVISVRNDQNLSTKSNEVILDWLRNFSELPKELESNHEALKFYLDVIRADLRLLESYKPKAELSYSHIPTFLSYGEGDQKYNRPSLEQIKNMVNVQEIKTFPGDHFYLLKDARSYVDWVLKHIPTSIKK